VEQLFTLDSKRNKTDENRMKTLPTISVEAVGLSKTIEDLTKHQYDTVMEKLLHCTWFISV
jgi:hypothetical protein